MSSYPTNNILLTLQYYQISQVYCIQEVLQCFNVYICIYIYILFISNTISTQYMQCIKQVLFFVAVGDKLDEMLHFIRRTTCWPSYVKIILVLLLYFYFFHSVINIAKMCYLKDSE